MSNFGFELDYDGGRLAIGIAYKGADAGSLTTKYGGHLQGHRWRLRGPKMVGAVIPDLLCRTDLTGREKQILVNLSIVLDDYTVVKEFQERVRFVKGLIAMRGRREE